MARQRITDVEGPDRVVPPDAMVESKPPPEPATEIPPPVAMPPVETPAQPAPSEEPRWAQGGNKRKGIPTGGWGAVLRCPNGHVKHWAETRDYVYAAEPGAAEAPCETCAAEAGSSATTPKQRPIKRAVKGISAETEEQRAAREAAERMRAEETARMERERAAEQARAQKMRFAEGVAFCEAMVGTPLMLAAGTWLQRKEHVDISTIKTKAIYTGGPGGPPIVMVETTVDKALAHGVAEVIALYAPDIFTHPALPAIATACLAFAAITGAVRDERIKHSNGAAQKVVVEVVEQPGAQS